MSPLWDSPVRGCPSSVLSPTHLIVPPSVCCPVSWRVVESESLRVSYQPLFEVFQVKRLVGLSYRSCFPGSGALRGTVEAQKVGARLQVMSTLARRGKRGVEPGSVFACGSMVQYSVSETSEEIATVPGSLHVCSSPNVRCRDRRSFVIEKREELASLFARAAVVPFGDHLSDVSLSKPVASGFHVGVGDPWWHR